MFVNTISEGIEEWEVRVITLTITSFVQKESVETVTIKKDTQKQSHILPKTVKVSGREKIKNIKNICLKIK